MTPRPPSVGLDRRDAAMPAAPPAKGDVPMSATALAVELPELPPERVARERLWELLRADELLRLVDTGHGIVVTFARARILQRRRRSPRPSFEGATPCRYVVPPGDTDSARRALETYVRILESPNRWLTGVRMEATAGPAQ